MRPLGGTLTAALIPTWACWATLGVPPDIASHRRRNFILGGSSASLNDDPR